MEKAVTLTGNPMVKGSLGSLYARGGRKADALKVLEELQEASKHRFVSPVFFAGLYWALGDKNQAVRFFDEAYEGRSTFLSQLRIPDWDSARGDPTFMAVEKKVGLYDQ